MTAGHSRELRRDRKRRVLRLLAHRASIYDVLPREDDESLAEIRRAVQQWGGGAPIVPLRRR